MSVQSGHRRYAARLGALPELIAHVREVCRAGGLGPAATLRIELVVEELFTNTVHHGYGADCDEPVWLTLELGPGELKLQYADAAPAFDPLAHVTDLDGAGGERAVGGLGVLLVRQFASDASYCRAEDRNVLTLLFRI